MNPNCGCGGQLTAPAPDNRPGLAALVYRAGNHFTFLETMKTRLRDRPALRGLSKWDGADFSIALLDGWVEPMTISMTSVPGRAAAWAALAHVTGALPAKR